MPKFSLSRSIEINASSENVYRVVRDFKRWTPWSPWILAEPDCALDFADDGKRYSWEGKIIGSGEMKILDDHVNTRIDYELTFLKPWKSTSAVSFQFAESQGATTTTWSMNGSLPFFLFWMKKMMSAMVGMDYQRGLTMLKDYVETGTVPSKLEFKGEGHFEGSPYIGIRTTCSLDNIGERMVEDFNSLQNVINDNGANPSGKPFTLYYKFDMVKEIAEYVAAIPVETAPQDLPSEISFDKMDACKTYQVVLNGPYSHLGNAWSAGMMHARSKVFKQAKNIPPFEVYETDPSCTPENDNITTVHFPVA